MGDFGVVRSKSRKMVAVRIYAEHVMTVPLFTYG